MFGFTGIQELVILMLIIGVLSATGLWPRIIRGIRELRGERVDSEDVTSQDTEMCYKVLGLSPSSKWAEIEKAYRIKAKIHHPDLGGDEDAMRVLNEVYSRLKQLHHK